MLRSLSSGISGMRNHQTRMDVIADNIANVNTVSFKYSRVIFKDVLSQSIRGSSSSGVGAGSVNPSQVGMGVTVGSIDRVFTQGISDPTSRSTDLTISGNGFFVVADYLGDPPGDGDIKAEDLYLTRDGAFYINDDGYLVNSMGQYVMGIRTSETGGDKTVVPINLKDIDFDETFENEYIESVSFGRDGMINVNGKTVFDDNYKLYVGVFQHENPEALVRYGNNLYECPVEDAGRIIDADKSSVAARTTFQVTSVPAGGSILNIGGYKIGFSDSYNVDDPVDGADFTINVNGMQANATDFSKLAATIRDLPIDDVKLSGEGNSITVSAAKTGKQGNEINVLADAFGIPTGAKLEGGEEGKEASLSFKVTGVPGDGTILTIAGREIKFSSEDGVNNDYESDPMIINTSGQSESDVAGKIRDAIDAAIGGADEGETIKGIKIEASGSTITITAVEPGYDGNAISMEATNYNAYSVVGQTFLAGGVDPVMASTRFDVSYVPADGTILTINGYKIGFMDGEDAVSGADEVINTSNMTASKVAEAIRNLDISGVELSGDGEEDSTTIIVTAAAEDAENHGNDITLSATTNNAFGNLPGLTNLSGGADSVPCANINESSGLNFGGMSGCGDIFSGNLEASNVDLSLEFSNMIVTQRGYQANARVITVSDSMLQELVDLKR